ncbi:MAG: PRTRC system protein C [Dehalococcoidia bacterium]|nr:PRTRC system protein C [Dehalococcoidia bacterium]
MTRVFIYDGNEFPDPDPGMTVDQVQKQLANFYGELNNATVKESKRDKDTTVYEFQKRVGTKGTDNPTA